MWFVVRYVYCNKKKETQYFLIVIDAHHYNKWVAVKKIDMFLQMMTYFGQ